MGKWVLLAVLVVGMGVAAAASAAAAAGAADGCCCAKVLARASI